jgi:DNA-binding transcriptional MocR family regulator
MPPLAVRAAARPAPPRTAAARAESRAAPLYARIAAELREQIDRGILRAGEKLPSIRALRRSRRVSAATVMEAYVRLERDGYVRVRDRSGFYVAQPPSHARPEPRAGGALAPAAPVGISQLVADVLHQTGEPKLIPLGVSNPTSALLPTTRVNRAFRLALTRWPLHSEGYGDLRGHPALRRQIAKRGVTLGTALESTNIIVTSGAMEALNLALRAVAAPGDVVGVESPTYFGVLQALEALGIRALEVPADPRTGIDLNLLAHAVRRHRVKAVLVMPTAHNPLGATMSDAAKKELVELCARYETPLIEDGAYSELTPEPRLPAKSFDRRGLVLYCGSFSKVLAPGLRVGWLEAGRFSDRVEGLKGITSLGTAVLPQLAVADLLESGFYERHLKRLRVRVVDQLARYTSALSEVLPAGARMTRPYGGTLIWIQLPDGKDGTELYRRLLARGIGIFPGEIFSPGRAHRGFIRISCAHPWSPAIERAIGVLGRLCGEI